MAGSYNHVIDDNGNLISPYEMDQMLENAGDVFEAVEEMYGMIWWLAEKAVKTDMLSPESLVEQACQQYTIGLALAKRNKNKARQV